MNTDSSSLLFIWLLTSGGAVANGQSYSLATPSDRLTAQEASTSGTRPLHLDEDMPGIPTGAAATLSPSPELNNSTLAANSSKGPQAEASTRPSRPATTAAAAATPQEMGSSISTPTLRRPGTTAFTSTPTTTSQSTRNTDAQPTAPSETPSTTARRTPKDIVRPEKKGARPKREATKDGNAGAVVAWVIGATLVLMMASFLVIYIKKRKLSEQQVTPKNWAGPSPFIENGEDTSQMRQASNRISLSSFLPQSLSRRLSLLPEADEEMEDISPGTTFGDRHEEASPDRQVAGRDVQGRPGAAAGAPETNATNDVAEKKDNSDTPPTPDDLVAVSFRDDFPANRVGETAQR